MPDFRQFALGLIARSPNVKNNPNAQELISVIQNNDEQRGIEIANNIIQSSGMSKEEYLSRASKFFGI